MIETLEERKTRLPEARHRWLKAVTLFPPLRDSPLQLRLAMLLWDRFNPHVGFAFPSRGWLADALDADMNTVSHAVGRLGHGDGKPGQRRYRPGLGIITVRKISGLPNSTSRMLAKYRRIDKRGQVYELNFGWSEAFLADAGQRPSQHGPWIISPYEPEQGRCAG